MSRIENVSRLSLLSSKGFELLEALVGGNFVIIYAISYLSDRYESCFSFLK